MKKLEGRSFEEESRAPYSCLQLRSKEFAGEVMGEPMLVSDLYLH